MVLLPADVHQDTSVVKRSLGVLENQQFIVLLFSHL